MHLTVNQQGGATQQRAQSHNQHHMNQAQYVNVTVVEARNLKAADFKGSSDPYCVMKVDNLFN